MTLKEQMADDLDVFFDTDEFAESATYKGAAILVVEAEVSDRNTGNPGFNSPVFSIYVSGEDVSRPKANDAVVFRGVNCRVGSAPISEGGVWRVDLMQDTVQI